MSWQALFMQIYELRKHGGSHEWADLEGEMLRGLGTGRYRVLWCRRKLVRPIQKLCRKVTGARRFQ